MTGWTRTVDSASRDTAANVEARALEVSEQDPTGEFPVLPMTPPVPESVHVIGDVVANRYVLRKHLGRGRYGEVYEAVDRSYSDPHDHREHAVALHLLSERSACHTHALQKLEACSHEPHLWSHPNIVKVRGFGCDGGQFFVVTELLRGLSLRAVLDDAPGERLSDDETFAVIRGVGDALKYGHAKGAIHGGIRPENVFITEDFAVKVLDYLPTTVPRTMPFFVEDALTPTAPEERDDVYGLACLAYELLTGRHPYNGNTPLEAWNAQLTLAPIPRIGEPRWSSLAQALALRGQDRTANVATFLADFGIKGYEILRPGDEDDVAFTGSHAGSAHVAKRSAPPAGSSPSPQSAASLERAVADFGLYSGLTTRDARRRRRSSHWRFTAVAALVAAIVGAAFLYSERGQRLAEQWLPTARSPVEDIPRAAGEQPAQASGSAPGTAAATLNDSHGTLAQPPAESASAPAEARERADTSADTARPEVARGTLAPDEANASVRAAEPPVARTEPPPRPTPEQIPAPSARASSIAEAEVIEFVGHTVTVSEGQGVARVVIRRRGGALGESSVVWWVSDGTASSADDYGDLGARIERLAAGADTRTLYVPIANDSLPENRESFFLHVRGEDSERGAESARTIEIVITDDD